MKIKVLTLNIWRYYEWENRKTELINFLKEQKADIVFLQEVALDSRLKDKFRNQLHEINSELNYSSESYHKMAKMDKWHKESITWDMWYGLGILSNFKIISTEIIILPHINKDKDFGFSHTVLKTDSGNIDLINVHLENTDSGSKEHLKYILSWCKEKNIHPIIAGDFNMKNTQDLNELANTDYEISYNLKKYKSFMPTDFSHNSEPITLDYIITNKSKFKILKVECIKNKSSDHSPVISEIELI